jgi:hypothetical protein
LVPRQWPRKFSALDFETADNATALNPASTSIVDSHRLRAALRFGEMKMQSSFGEVLSRLWPLANAPGVVAGGNQLFPPARTVNRAIRLVP